MGKAMYRVYYLNTPQLAFHTRDEAVAWAISHADKHERLYDNYEIRDNSDAHY